NGTNGRKQWRPIFLLHLCARHCCGRHSTLAARLQFGDLQTLYKDERNYDKSNYGGDSDRANDECSEPARFRFLRDGGQRSHDVMHKLVRFLSLTTSAKVFALLPTDAYAFPLRSSPAAAKRLASTFRERLQ